MTMNSSSVPHTAVPAGQGAGNGAGPAPNGHPHPQNSSVATAEAEAAQEDADEQDEEYYDHTGTRFLVLNAVPSWLTSMVFHIVVLILLALMSVPTPPPPAERTLEVGRNEEVQDIE
jgi:hypothetical protein